MNKTHARRKRDIKNKLMAAICMLLVSSIMMVSSTYAWFTLSTAPEVTGINTAVGANGNLEMALMPKDGITTGAAAGFGITSGVGDSMDNWLIKNHTWGNLVDVSDSSYGMEKIQLYPASLNVSSWDDDTAKLNPTGMAVSMLKTPAYGADGRVSELKADTVTSTYVSADGAFPQNSEYGVRAVGTASGMTDRQLAYRNYRSSASTAMSKAKTDAGSSLHNNGAALANIALAHGADSSATHTLDDVEALKAIIVDLLGTDDGTTGILEYAEKAYLDYIIAYAASAANEATYGEDGTTKVSGMTDTEFKAFVSNMESATDLYTAIESLDITLPEEFSTRINELKATREKVNEALTLVNELLAKGDGKTDEEKAAIKISWEEIRKPLDKLVNTENMTVNGIPVSEVKDRASDLAASMSNGLYVTMPVGGGVYADLADHCGDYQAKVVLENISAAGITIDRMEAFMQTEAEKTHTPYLLTIGKVVTAQGAPSSAGGEIQPLTDMYGYIIDLAFRTNAAASNLLLQTEAADRIYADQENNEDTMGHGSSMTFTATTSDFTIEQMRGLMECIRIVFFDPTAPTENILATAMLDMTTAVTGADGISVTAQIYLYTNEASVSYVEATVDEGATHVAVTTTTYVETTEGATHIADADAEGGYRPINDGETATHKAETTTTYREATDGETAEYKVVTGAAAPVMQKTTTDAVITALNQNEAKAVSVLVYLDGESITNADVAATGTSSMTGTMNLQFASSANLVPMEYTPLMEQGSTSDSDEEEDEEETTSYTVTLPEGVTGNDTATAGADYTFTVDTTAYTLGTVTVGDTVVTPTDNGSGSYTIPAASVTGDIVITVTAVATSG